MNLSRHKIPPIKKTLKKSSLVSNKKLASSGPHILAIPIKIPVSPYTSGPFSNPKILLNSGDRIEKCPPIQAEINKTLIIYKKTLLTEKYKVVEIKISIPVIMNIKILKPNLSIRNPHKNLEDPFTIPNNIPR
jgi:hypothetical protein